MSVKVCDMIMGSGKTESAITQINQDRESLYVFITPYLDEVDRVKERCADRHFKDPQSKGEGGKLEDLHYLLSKRQNIASTHALFKSYNEQTIRLIQDGGYKLILDEAFQAVQIINASQKDIQIMKRDLVKVSDSGQVVWTEDGYDGMFKGYMEMCLSGNVVLHKDYLLLWDFPIEVFRAFQDIVILTYLFDAQIQKYYFDANGVEVEHIGTVCENGEYHFTQDPSVPEYVRSIPEKIHIVEDAKLNRIGDPQFSLSASWYAKAKAASGQPQIKRVRNNVTNFFKNKCASSSDRNMWTVFKEYQNLLKGKGYTKGFLPCNIRSTNAYRERNCLAYCVNVYYNPMLKNYFMDHGVDVREDEYALSEMIQWIWRSAIRDGEDIWVYIPSRRMRELLQNWLKSLCA